MSVEATQALIISFSMLFFLLFIGVPIAWVLLVSGLVGLVMLIGIQKSLAVFNSTAWSTATKESLTCLPLFIAMGRVVAQSGLGDKLFALANSFVGRLRGGMGIATSIASGLFGAISGSIFAAIGTLGPIVIPQMGKFGYNKNFAAAILASAGTFASMIPPSIALIVYGFMTDTSISKLFMAALIPGIITIVVYSITIYLWVTIKPSLAPAVDFKSTWRQRGKLTLDSFPIGVVALTVLGGIYMGWFTATEAAGIGLAMLLAIAIATRRIGLKGIGRSFISSGRTFATLAFLLIGGYTLSSFVAISRIPFEIADLIEGMGLSQYALLGVVILFYFILGCLMDAIGILILSVPIMFPVMQAAGFDSIWFGVFVVKLCEIAVVTPPVGFMVYMTESIARDADVQSGNIFGFIWGFVAADLAVLALMIVCPQLCLWLPGTMS
jgi:C4-dicarboxylate transporter DctM subunit